eukprot:11748883-Heterocapsa_arctica.AAC.1
MGRSLRVTGRLWGGLHGVREVKVGIGSCAAHGWSDVRSRLVRCRMWLGTFAPRPGLVFDAFDDKAASCHEDRVHISYCT